MSLATATVRSAVWNHAGKIAEFLLMYVASLIVARGLGVADNGVFASIVSLSQLLLVFSSFGLEAVINKCFPQLPPGTSATERSYLFRRILALRASLFALGAASVWLLSRIIPGLSGPTHDWLALLIAYAFSRSLIPLFAIALTAEMRTDLTAIINVAARMIELLVLGWGSLTSLTLSFVMATFVGSGVVQLAAYMLVSRNFFAGAGAATVLRPALAFGGVFWLNSLVDYILGRQGDIFLLSRLLPSTTFASLYDVSYSTIQIAHLGATAGLAGVTFATFARLSARSPSEMAPFYHLLIRVVTLLTVPLFAFLLFNSEALVLSLYGSAFVGAAILIQGMAAFRILSRLFGGGENAEFLLSIGGVKRLVIAGVVAASCNAGLNLLLIPSLAAEGSVIASGTANLLANSIGFMLIRRRVRLQPGFWAQMAIISVVLSFGVSYIETGSAVLTLLARFALFCVLTVTSIFAFRVVSREDTRKVSDALFSRIAPHVSDVKRNS
ncbi:MAG TPA: oligosaccharide flippase family protein [Bacteroidota bacterium]|nr:oligosaccharide flippase family protein [Bacteroidota bacterium]